MIEKLFKKLKDFQVKRRQLKNAAERRKNIAYCMPRKTKVQ